MLRISERLMRDPVLQNLLAKHLYAISPDADARIVARDAIAMLGCYLDLIQRFDSEEIHRAVDRMTKQLFPTKEAEEPAA